MSMNEKIKEQIGWLKVVFAISSAILVTLCGWLANNYDNTDTISIISATALIIFFAFVVVLANKVAYKKMDELEEL